MPRVNSKKIAKQSHIELAHILGLKPNPFSELKNQYWENLPAVTSTQNRYNEFAPESSSSLNFTLFSSQPNNKILQDLDNLPRGGYLGFSTSWPGHAYSLHAVKDKGNTHFIYVNRDEKKFERVIAFTVPNKEAAVFAEDLVSTAKSENRNRIQDFLNSHQDKKNKSLTKTLDKSPQKTNKEREQNNFPFSLNKV